MGVGITLIRFYDGVNSAKALHLLRMKRICDAWVHWKNVTTSFENVYKVMISESM